MRHQKRWDELSPRSRKLIVALAAVEGVLKVTALVDLARRPADRVHGSKAKWAVAIIVVNSAGLLPIYYFARGRY
ncbi:MAG TPA: DUF5652 family protein [Acidimicrobiales bacterium]|nr:DUF5652 family protein [Acidimicrobiales bacterium]